MMGYDARLSYLANQIARNLAVRGHDAATRATAEHIATFWDPHARDRLFELDSTELERVTNAAIAMLLVKVVPQVAPMDRMPADGTHKARAARSD